MKGATTESTQRARALQSEIERIEKESGAKAIAVALHDLETGLELQHHADRWFHAASTIKVPILLGAFAAIDRGDLLPHSRVHVRNRFLSVVEDIPFRVESGREHVFPPAVDQTLERCVHSRRQLIHPQHQHQLLAA